MAQINKLYLIKTKTDLDGDGNIENKIHGVFTSQKAAETCIEEVKARYSIERHNVTTARAEITVVEIDANTFYENIENL